MTFGAVAKILSSHERFHVLGADIGDSDVCPPTGETKIDSADRCRSQAEECRWLLLLAESGAEATILTSLCRSWSALANQTDRYTAIVRKEAAQKGLRRRSAGSADKSA